MLKRIAIALTLLLLISCGRNLDQYQYLKKPQISDKPSQKMIVVKAIGDPNVVGGKAFKLLFKTFFKVKREEKGLKMAAPRARWPLPLETPRQDWIGLYALPVPERVKKLPIIESETGLKAVLETWEYGETGEILHIGSYASEPPTVKRLHDLLVEKGYEIAGPHEEEYIKGPGMFLKGNPDKYQTIIRYPVKKIEETDK